MLSLFGFRKTQKQEKNTKESSTETIDSITNFSDLPSENLPLTDSVYPPADAPMSAISAEDVMRTQAALIRELMTAVSMIDEEKNKFLFPVIKNLAAFVHLLPASQSHHHNGRGGLFRHSLETALFAVNIAKNRILEVNANPVDIYHNKSRWYLAIAIAGLLHDAGKCLTDITVTSLGGTSTWLPTVEPLSSWLKKNEIKDFFCSWNLNRINKQHECAGSIVYSLLVPVETRQYLEESHSTKLKNELYESLAGIKREGAEIASTIIKADSASTKKDISRQLREGFHPGVNAPIVVWLEKIMQQLVDKKVWKTNVVDSPLWVTEKGIFLVWHRATKDIERAVNEGNFPSIPRDSKIWQDKLQESSLVENRVIEEKDGDVPVQLTNWRILPLPELEYDHKNKNENTASNNLNFLTAMKLADDTLLFANGGKPAPVTVFIEGDSLTPEEESLWLSTTNLPLSSFVTQALPTHIQAPLIDDEEIQKAVIEHDFYEIKDEETGEITFEESEKREIVFEFDPDQEAYGFYTDPSPYPDVQIDHILAEIASDQEAQAPNNQSGPSVATNVSKPPKNIPEPLKKDNALRVEPKPITNPKVSEDELLSPSQLQARNRKNQKQMQQQQKQLKLPVKSDQSSNSSQRQTRVSPKPAHAKDEKEAVPSEPTDLTKQKTKPQKLSVKDEHRIVASIFNQVKEQLQIGYGDLLEAVLYRDDCIFSSTAPIERALDEHEINFGRFIEKLERTQKEPILHIDDKRAFVFLERKTIRTD